MGLCPLWAILALNRTSGLTRTLLKLYLSWVVSLLPPLSFSFSFHRGQTTSQSKSSPCLILFLPLTPYLSQASPLTNVCISNSCLGIWVLEDPTNMIPQTLIISKTTLSIFCILSFFPEILITDKHGGLFILRWLISTSSSSSHHIRHLWMKHFEEHKPYKMLATSRCSPFLTATMLEETQTLLEHTVLNGANQWIRVRGHLLKAL